MPAAPRPPVTRAREIAQSIAEKSAPLGVQATLLSAHRAREEGDAAAVFTGR